MRGEILKEALDIINGERIDLYGNPEDSFGDVSKYWRTYLETKFDIKIGLTAKDVSMMLALMKIARETNQGKKDNLVDAAGYIGLAADLSE